MTTTTTRSAWTALDSEAEPELPGLTDEALRLLEVAREELAAAEPQSPRNRWCRLRFRAS